MKRCYLPKAGKYFTKHPSAMVTFSRMQRNVNSRLSPILAYSRALQGYTCRKAFHLRHQKNTSLTMSLHSQKSPHQCQPLQGTVLLVTQAPGKATRKPLLSQTTILLETAVRYFYCNKNQNNISLHIYTIRHVFSNNNTIIN